MIFREWCKGGPGRPLRQMARESLSVEVTLELRLNDEERAVQTSRERADWAGGRESEKALRQQKLSSVQRPARPM